MTFDFTDGSDVIERLIRFVTDHRWEEVPAAPRGQRKLPLLDPMSVLAVGTKTPATGPTA